MQGASGGLIDPGTLYTVWKACIKPVGKQFMQGMHRVPASRNT